MVTRRFSRIGVESRDCSTMVSCFSEGILAPGLGADDFLTLWAEVTFS